MEKQGITRPARASFILEAVRFTASGDITSLERLLSHNLLKLEHVLRILLTFLPEGIEPKSYVSLLKELAQGRSIATSSFDRSRYHGLSDEEICSRASRIRLLALAPDEWQVQDADSLTQFLIHQAYRIDAQTGSLHLVAQLIDEFIDHSNILKTWAISNLLPQLRLHYEYYLGSKPRPSLLAFSRLSDEEAIQYLLSRSTQNTSRADADNFGRDARGLVAPWMYGATSRKRLKIDRAGLSLPLITTTSISEEQVGKGGWAWVNQKLLELQARNFSYACKCFVGWDGPYDVDYGHWASVPLRPSQQTLPLVQKEYAQAGLGIIYGIEKGSEEAAEVSYSVLKQVAELSCENMPFDIRQASIPSKCTFTPDFLRKISTTHLLYHTLLQPGNPLTAPSSQSDNLANLLIWSSHKISKWGTAMSTRDAARLSLFGSRDEQLEQLGQTLQSIQNNENTLHNWLDIRDQLLWLRRWTTGPQKDDVHEAGLFCKIPRLEFETQILKTLVEVKQYEIAANLYCKRPETSLPLEFVEEAILTVAYSAYDAASNGNRNRGGVRKASEIVAAFRVYFASKQFARIEALLSATHAMSFYSLSIAKGVPFRPVNIRSHSDPITLIRRILEQNPRSYTHLDDLLNIGRNLITAGLLEPGTNIADVSEDERHAQDLLDAQRRVCRMSIEAALAEDDFDTAYSYVVNRLSLPNQNTGNQSMDDVSWRAAYAAGRQTQTTDDRLTLGHLEQRMELLSKALLLAPPSALPDILSAWQECEQQMIDLLASEIAEQQDWDRKGSQKIPGGFSNESNSAPPTSRDRAAWALPEEAPMGLFEVARGAASALRKNAFPLRGSQPGDAHSTSQNEKEGTMISSEGLDSSGRVRKRDMVSNMVTGGLVSGIGWVIGAPPVKPE